MPSVQTHNFHKFFIRKDKKRTVLNITAKTISIIIMIISAGGVLKYSLSSKEENKTTMAESMKITESASKSSLDLFICLPTVIFSILASRLC
ncbi:hypothetical protein COB28_01870 [Candidatus Dependentiae bacterium]|nr:MAG: hypothetical protein COB28_01870 [Candidatus Dependentiae bacterium]